MNNYIQGSLETKEYLLPRVAETLQLPSGRLPLLAALLGTHLLGEDELAAFHRRVCPDHTSGKVLFAFNIQTPLQ
jgi:hypothetical protein